MMLVVHGSTLQRAFQEQFRTISIRSTLRFQRMGVHGRLLVRTLYTSADRGKSWESVWEASEKIRMIA